MDKNNFIKPDRGSERTPDHIMLSICGDAKSTMCVTWRTSTEVADGYILYAEEGSEDYQRLDAINEIFESDIDISYMHWARLDGLKSGTRYKYSVGNDSHRSSEFCFETEPENLEEFRFLLITDQQRGEPLHRPNYEVESTLLKDAFSRFPDIRFILTAGDNCNNGENEIQWNGMFSGLVGVIESVPYMMCTGNHDGRGERDYFSLTNKQSFYSDKCYFFDAQFANSYPLNGPDGLKGENYSFDYGNAHFVSIGVNYQDGPLGDWLFDDVSSSDKRWKIGAYHFPIYPVMPEGENSDSYPWLRRGIEEGRLDILINGHEHSFARTYPIKDDQMYDRPSQGTVHYIAGNSGRNIYHSNTRKIWHSCYYPLEENIYLYVIGEVKRDTLRLTAYLEDGRIADELVIDKQRDVILPYACAPIFDKVKMSFKGLLPELAAKGQFCEKKDGLWYCPFGTLAGAFGGEVIKEKGRISIDFYDKKAHFYEDSSVAMIDSGAYNLKGKVYRSNNQLYIPVDDAAEIFDMQVIYAERNGLIDFENNKEKASIKPNP